MRQRPRTDQRNESHSSDLHDHEPTAVPVCRVGPSSAVSEGASASCVWISTRHGCSWRYLSHSTHASNLCLGPPEIILSSSCSRSVSRSRSASTADREVIGGAPWGKCVSAAGNLAEMLRGGCRCVCPPLARKPFRPAQTHAQRKRSDASTLQAHTHAHARQIAQSARQIHSHPSTYHRPAAVRTHGLPHRSEQRAHTRHASTSSSRSHSPPVPRDAPQSLQ